MTVKELIVELKQQDPNAGVLVGSHLMSVGSVRGGEIFTGPRTRCSYVIVK